MTLLDLVSWLATPALWPVYLGLLVICLALYLGREKKPEPLDTHLLRTLQNRRKG